MRKWQLTKNDPMHLTIAADARLCGPDYLNDHIWEVRLDGGTPPALSIQTNYGLRARLMRLFPRFQFQDEWISDPDHFFKGPVITGFFPNYLALTIAPFRGLDVISEYWVPDSQTLAGRLTISNPSVIHEKYLFEWVSLLSHLGDGQGMAVTESGISQVMEGKTGDLSPVCVMTGGPQAGSGPYAGLAFEIDLMPGDSRQLTWAMATLADSHASLERARSILEASWDAEIARIELINESQSVEINTGDLTLDSTIAFSQKAANSIFFPPNQYLPKQSFVLSREPENGSSLRGDGKDYNHLWSGQTALDAWYLGSILGSAQADRISGIIENFIKTQQENGCLDWKPGLAGQRSGRLAQPVLASLAWSIASEIDDPSWLGRVYPALLDFIHCWFEPASDRDQDGFPEWEHPFQIGLDDIPLFHPWQKDAQGVDPDVIESPSLAAMLYRDCTALIQMADKLGRSKDIAWLRERQEILTKELGSNWNDAYHSYMYRDAQIQDSPAGETLLELSSTGTYPVARKFDTPRRLLLQFRPRDEMTRQNQLLLNGETPDGPATEEVNPRSIHWLHGVGRYTTRHHFTRLVEVIVRVMLPGDHCSIRTIDFTTEDISLLLPLWAGIPNQERGSELVNKTILPRYRQRYGLPICPPDRQMTEPLTEGISLIWNQLIVEGLLQYGFRAEAASFAEDLIRVVANNLQESRAFWSSYQVKTGQGQGDRNTLSGIAPVGLFLKILGLQKISSNRVIVDGLNPFSRTVTVQYRGTTVTFFNGKTIVTFVGGQTVEIIAEGFHEIALP